MVIILLEKKKRGKCFKILIYSVFLNYRKIALVLVCIAACAVHTDELRLVEICCFFIDEFGENSLSVPHFCGGLLATFGYTKLIMHIVLVDGSRTGLMILQRMLEPRGDDVAYFTDGREALDYIRSTPQAEVLITSFEIGGVSGTELCWEARILADAGRPLYVIGMSASNDAQHSISVLDAGADDFMSKPPRQDELNARLRVAERTLIMQRRLIEMATIDPLSGLFNRGAFRQRFDAEIEVAKLGGTFSLILFDIDHFKQINDIYGHDTGDEVIRSVGSLRVPPDAHFSRIGGEEFAVILPSIPIDGGIYVADYLRGQVSDLTIERNDNKISTTASFGVAEFRAGDTVNDLYRRADAALYQAKNTGRDRVSASAPEIVS